MKMDIYWAEQLQENLQEMVSLSDDMTCAYFLGGPLPHQSERQLWQEGVDMIYRLLKCDILRLWPPEAIQEESDLLEFVQALARKDPLNNISGNLPGRWALPWCGPLLYPSARCKTLIKKYGIDNSTSELEKSFIDELEAIFETAGVGFSNEALLPISQIDGAAVIPLPIDIAKHIQLQLQIMAAAPRGVAPLNFVETDAPAMPRIHQWQNAVDVTYRLFKSGLINIVSTMNTDDPDTHFSLLSDHSPFDMDADGIRIWTEVRLQITTSCGKLMKKHGVDINGSPFNQHFADEIESMFEAVNHPWALGPSFSVTAGRRFSD